VTSDQRHGALNSCNSLNCEHNLCRFILFFRYSVICWRIKQCKDFVQLNSLVINAASSSVPANCCLNCLEQNFCMCVCISFRCSDRIARKVGAPYCLWFWGYWVHLWVCEWVTDWMRWWVCEWRIEWGGECVTDLARKWVCEWRIEWDSECVSEWVTDCVG
jgi:hypothetical protein